MTDAEKREKVISGMEHCIGDNCDGDTWGECEYSRNGCIDALLEDALALLKAQEPVEPKQYEGTSYCGNCGDPINKLDNYCHECGQAVKWE